MEERKALILKYVSMGMKVSVAAPLVGMSKSSYYYKHKKSTPGRKPSLFTIQNGIKVPNEQLVEQIKDLIGDEFMEYGYRKTTYDLLDKGFVIGKRKTFRIMKENKLLLPRKRTGEKVFVRFTQPLPFEPFEKLEMDIKFIYIRGERRNALLFTILDTFTRIALVWDLQYSIRNTRVAQLFVKCIDDWLQAHRPPIDGEPSVTLRSDNDSRFIALELKKFMSDNFINQEFILPATPQQNAHVESFHSVVEQLVCKKYEFNDLQHARQVFDRFYHTYNNKRTISSLSYLPPTVFLKEWELGNIGMMLTKKHSKIKQSFFFRGQRPKWHPVPHEEFLIGQCKINTEINKFVKPELIES